MVRSLLGTTTFDGGTSTQTSYGFFAKVPELLKLSEWVPHQDLAPMDAVIEITPESTQVLVSHQWAPFDHPDPNGDQLNALQSVIQAHARRDVGRDQHCAHRIYGTGKR